MRRFIFIICTIIITISSAQAADVNQALYGWAGKTGIHYNGTLGNEGGFQNLKGDSGNFRNGKNCGGTNFGITCRDHPGIKNIRKLTKVEAAQIYHDNEWETIRGDEIKSQYLGYKLFDLAVNGGTGSAAILLEKTVNALNGVEKDLPLTGHVTKEHIVWLNNYTKDRDHREKFVAYFKLFAAERYISISRKNPKLRTFLLTWMERDIKDE